MGTSDPTGAILKVVACGASRMPRPTSEVVAKLKRDVVCKTYVGRGFPDAPFAQANQAEL